MVGGELAKKVLISLETFSEGQSISPVSMGKRTPEVEKKKEVVTVIQETESSAINSNLINI